MNWNIIFLIYGIVLVIGGTVVTALIVRDLVSGRYRRFKKLQDEFTEFEREVERRRKKMQGRDE